MCYSPHLIIEYYLLIFSRLPVVDIDEAVYACMYFPFTIRWSLKGTRAVRHVTRARFPLFS